MRNAWCVMWMRARQMNGISRGNFFNGNLMIEMNLPKTEIMKMWVMDFWSISRDIENKNKNTKNECSKCCMSSEKGMLNMYAARRSYSLGIKCFYPRKYFFSYFLGLYFYFSMPLSKKNESFKLFQNQTMRCTTYIL